LLLLLFRAEVEEKLDGGEEKSTHESTGEVDIRKNSEQRRTA
jgi:hypothetical protein